MHRLLPFAAASALLFCASPPAGAQSQDLPARLEALAARGNGEAAYHLGMIYHMGLNGVTRDPRRALELFRASATAGDPLGAYKLGCYYDGQGEGLVEPDPELALRHKLVAAQAGYALAQSDVARLYFQRGDDAQGLRWLNAAAMQGDLMSLSMLVAFYSGRVPDAPVQRDPVRAYAFALLGVRRVAQTPPEGFVQAEVEAGLGGQLGVTEAEAARGRALAAGWTIEPTPLTRHAGSGQQAAEALVR